MSNSGSEKDSEDDVRTNKPSDFTAFLFGNINEEGELENDFLDNETKRHLSSLGKLGLEPIITEIVDEKDIEVSFNSDDDANSSCDEDIPGHLPDAVDYSDINELADEDDSCNDRKESSGNNDNNDQSENCDGNSSDMPAKPKLNTPLAGILPEKYANVDVKELFPQFSPDKILRFSRLFGSNSCAGAKGLPSRWKSVKKRMKKRRLHEQLTTVTSYRTGWVLNLATPPSSPSKLSPDEEALFLKPAESKRVERLDENTERKENEPDVADWRFGPAKLWFDMINVPEDGDGFDYGFKLREKPKASATFDQARIEYPFDANFLISQITWEEDIIWNGEDIKQEVLAKLNSKTNAAGWIPTSSNRVAQTFSHPSKGQILGSSGVFLKPSEATGVKPMNKTAGVGGTKQQQSADETTDEVWFSSFPIENEELVRECWEEEIIWDDREMDYIPKPSVLVLDPNDEELVLRIPDDIDPSKQKVETAVPSKVKIPHPHVKKSKMLLGKAGVINRLEEDTTPSSPTKSPDHDPFNISNDKYYVSRTNESSLKIGVGSLIQHSTPAIELRAPFVQTHMGTMRLRTFHRPVIKRYSHGVLAKNERHFVTPLTKYIKKKTKQREQERTESGGGDIFFMRTPEDLTGRDGDLILVEFCEEHPPLMNLVGMCSKIKNYYKRKPVKDPGPPELKYGEASYAHQSPFLGSLTPGKALQSLENNMFRAPIYEHEMLSTDFLVIRTRNQYFIREVNGLFVAGQQCPLYEVPSPNSKRANNFVRDFLQVFIYRLFWKSKGVPKRICMDDVRRAFPSHSESSIRKRLKLCADFKRTGNDSNLWVIKKDFRLPPEEEIREMVSPEQCCAYFSMIAAEQRLKDAGYGEKFLFPTAQDEDEDDLQLKMDDEIKVAPWNTTRAYIQAMKGKCLLQLTGPADPTGCGEGFSYIRVPNKPVTKQKEEQKSQPKRIVTGTDADLRRLSLNNAKALLRKFGVPEDEIKKLSRWEVIDVVRTLSTEKAKAGEEGMTKFSRGNRFSIAEHQERYKEECQRIFDLQNRVLTSNEVLSTDEEESSDEENGSDIEEMGKNIENMLANKKTSVQLSLEKEEQERQELKKLIMQQNNPNSEESNSQKKKKKEDADHGDSSSVSGQGSRILRIYRTFRDADGKDYTRLEVVRNQAVIDHYIKIRTTKDEEFIRQFAMLDDAQKEEMKREKRRIQEQLRRIKRNQEKERITAELRARAAAGGSANNAAGTAGSASSKSSLGKTHFQLPSSRTMDKYKPVNSHQSDLANRRRLKTKPDLKVKCGACGATGHMRTNKACPQYQQSASAPVTVALTQEEELEIDKKLDDVEDLVNIDGTKLKLSGKLIRHAEDVKRRSLLLKVPKEAITTARKRKSTGGEDLHCDYLKKHRKTTNRRCIDPVVALSSILESILNEMRDMSNVQPFLFPVNAKMVPDYYNIVTKPMDLQTMRDKLREKKYQKRETFLTDINQIVENSTRYNGAKSCLTLAAKQMLELCFKRLAEKEDKLMRLEKAINPLLDDNEQVAFNFILKSTLEKIKSMPEVWPFLKPVNKRLVKDYYEIIKQPIDLESISNNVRLHKYRDRYEFLADIELIVTNCIAYNGRDSAFTTKARLILDVARSSLEACDNVLSNLEAKLKNGQNRTLEATVDDELSDDQIPDDKDGENNDYDDVKSQHHKLLEDDLHCSSEDEEDDADMMEEVKGIEVEVGSRLPPDYESREVAEAMMQLGNFDYTPSSSLKYGSSSWQQREEDVDDAFVADDIDVNAEEEEEGHRELEVKAFPLDDNLTEDCSNNAALSSGLKMMEEDLEISDSEGEDGEQNDLAIKQEKASSFTADSDKTDDNDGLWF